MATAFTWNWRVTCRRYSLADDTIYYYDFPAAQSREAADDLKKELTTLGFKEVRVSLINNLP